MASSVIAPEGIKNARDKIISITRMLMPEKVALRMEIHRSFRVGPLRPGIHGECKIRNLLYYMARGVARVGSGVFFSVRP